MLTAMKHTATCKGRVCRAGWEGCPLPFRSRAAFGAALRRACAGQATVPALPSYQLLRHGDGRYVSIPAGTEDSQGG